MTDFYLAILNSPDDARPHLVASEIANGDFESFAARFINGLVHQVHAQTGHARPIGETTANRIAGDLFALVNAVAGSNREFDYHKLQEKLRLDTYQPSPPERQRQ